MTIEVKSDFNKIKAIHSVAHHRNGVIGKPFFVILFSDESSRKLGIVFREPHYCTVLDVAKLSDGDVAFGSNSWRGDIYQPDLRAVVAAFEGEEATLSKPKRSKRQTSKVTEKPKKFSNLIATASTMEDLLKSAKVFWCNSEIRFEGNEAYNSKGKINGFYVERKGRRFRLLHSPVEQETKSSTTD